MNDVIIRAMANDIVAGIVVDLCDKGGLQEIWEEFGVEAQARIKDEWVDIAVGRMNDMKDMVHSGRL